MPFTLVHPVAVLPLARGPLSLLALVSGAVAPDLPYYLRATPLPVTAQSWYEPYTNATTSHALEGLLPVALPLALVVYLCGCLLLPPLRWVLGQDPQPSSDAPARGAVVHALQRGTWVVVSLLIGVLTHLAWDALTDGTRLLQHGSTALGVVVLGLVIWRRRSHLHWHDTAVRRRVLAVVVPGLLVALAGAVITTRSWHTGAAGFSTGQVIEGILTDAAKGAGVGVLATLAALTLCWWAARLARAANAAASSRGVRQ